MAKKKVTKKATKKGATKKATKKVAKKKVSKKVTKKATKKKVSTKKPRKVVAKKKDEQKELTKQLEKEFKSMKFTGTMTIGIDGEGKLLIKKESDSEEVNQIMNDILTAFETSIAAKELLPVFNQAIFENLKKR